MNAGGGVSARPIFLLGARVFLGPSWFDGLVYFTVSGDGEDLGTAQALPVLRFPYALPTAA